MSVPEIQNSSVNAWEDFLRDRGNFHEIQYHGGGTKASWFLAMVWHQSTVLTSDDRHRLYEHMVQATLNLWGELAAVERDEWEDNPILVTARFAFTSDYRLYEECRTSYERLWLESPRPLSGIHRSIAANSEGELPLKPQDVSALFELDGWRLIALRLAAQKRFTNTMIRLGDILEVGDTKLTIDEIASAVDSGFPRDKAIQWLRKLYPLSERASVLMELWGGAE